MCLNRTHLLMQAGTFASEDKCASGGPCHTFGQAMKTSCTQSFLLLTPNINKRIFLICLLGMIKNKNVLRAVKGDSATSTVTSLRSISNISLSMFQEETPNQRFAFAVVINLHMMFSHIMSRKDVQQSEHRGIKDKVKVLNESKHLFPLITFPQC